MSPSALIAHRYRLSTQKESLRMQISTTAYQISSERPVADTWSRSVTFEDEVEDKDRKLKQRLEESSIVRHILCNIPPTIIDHTEQSVDILEDNARHASNYPALSLVHLIILGFAGIFNAPWPKIVLQGLAQHLWRLIGFYVVMLTYICEYIDNIRKSRVDPKTMVPQKVFSPSAFQEYVNHTNDERNHPMTKAAMDVTHRLLLRLEAIKASSIATEWRSRYDDPQFLASVDRRFSWQWNDPADPIFHHLGPRPVNVTVIHSTFPCSAPHIVIHGTEPNDPWTLWGNSTGVQDCAYGNALVVISTKTKGVPLAYINTPGDETDSYSSILASPDHDEFGVSEDGSSFCSNTSGPGTPTELQRVGSGFFSEAIDEDLVKCRYESYSAYISGLHNDIAINTAEDDPNSLYTPSHTSSGKFYIADDDDEDEDEGPPEYDEWYISIANRTGLTEQTGTDLST
ncbi:hypothetical protein JR316_0004639 [Psilocybe cubensis]|uniref:Uncharacterized protein n=1 Tax=Psilocybe cubensis TaxID=181762 RepID=A0ACB8H5S5_PSICU|nr:hypothetical protein JR316_0004639 [Psilocybe cubensis]KAH9482539.1 hypothetical protein JR316_0004639 [Psilocybe cubensis]